MTSSDDDPQLFEELSIGLRNAHRRVAQSDVPDAEKASITRNLLAISDASKHDLVRAKQRLDRLVERFPDGDQAP